MVCPDQERARVLVASIEIDLEANDVYAFTEPVYDLARFAIWNIE